MRDVLESKGLPNVARPKRSKARTPRRSAGSAGALDPHPSAVVSEPGDWMASLISALAIEIWRLERRIESEEATPERIKDSHGRLRRVLADYGVEVRDQHGERFAEGMIAEVLDMPAAANPHRDVLIVSGVVRPGVFIRGRCITVPQLIVCRPSE